MMSVSATNTRTKSDFVVYPAGDERIKDYRHLQFK